MAWFRLDDTFTTHPKARAAGLQGRALYIEALAHCSRHLTDGFIDGTMIPLLAALAEVPVETADRLVSVGMWEEVEGGYAVHDYAQYQRSSAEARDLREKRAAAGRLGGLARAQAQAQASASGASKQTPSKPASTEQDSTESFAEETDVSSSRPDDAVVVALPGITLPGVTSPDPDEAEALVTEETPNNALVALYIDRERLHGTPLDAKDIGRVGREVARLTGKGWSKTTVAVALRLLVERGRPIPALEAMCREVAAAPRVVPGRLPLGPSPAPNAAQRRAAKREAVLADMARPQA